MKSTIKIFLLIILTMVSCKNKVEEKQHTVLSEQKTIDITGNYVDEFYKQKNEGYDFVVVKVVAKSNDLIRISVRSRADKKKPTCTFDTDAKKVNDTLYTANVEGKSINFIFKNESVSIDAENEIDEGVLTYYCSGGGSLKATYSKILEPLDSSIDPRNFVKRLNFENFIFKISSIGEGSIQQLVIQPYGLEISNEIQKMEIEGSVVNAEIGDLNLDGFPEILIYTVSAGSGSYGNVIGYSVNNGKSMSQIYLPEISNNEEASKGYMGHDEFRIVEATLVQRFRLYNEGDTNANASGKIRQIQYKLVDDEASRKFVVDKIIEF